MFQQICSLFLNPVIEEYFQNITIAARINSNLVTNKDIFSSIDNIQLVAIIYRRDVNNVVHYIRKIAVAEM